MKHPVLSVLAAVLSLALPAMSARAEETPEATYAARRAALPAPSAEGGFDVKGAFVFGGSPAGTFAMAAKPGTTPDGKPGWICTLQIDAFGGSMQVDQRTLYDAHLKPVKGATTTKKGEETTTTAWEVVAEGVRVGEGEGEEAKVLAHEGAFITSFTTLALYCKLVGAAPGTQATDIFDADDGEFVSGTWTTGAEGMWNGVKARIASGKRADGKTIEIGFDAGTGAVLGLKAGQEGQGAMFEFRPGETPKQAGAGDLFDRPAKTAQEAAVQAALSFATADFDLLERVTHWPSIAKAIKAQSPETASLDDESIKEIVMGQLRAAVTPQAERAVVAPMLASIADSLATEKNADGETVVAFGPAFRNLKLTVDEFDGQWYLVRFPTP